MAMHNKKEFNSILDQIKILKARGLNITDVKKASQILKTENYYNLINGYKSPFIASCIDSPNERYIEKATFDEIYALYQFDRELRSVFLKYILIIENSVKSVLAHKFAQKYGFKDYLDPMNFNIDSKNARKDSSKIVYELISKMHSDIAYQLGKSNPMISHYVFEYGYIPPWVLVNIISFGTMSKWYSALEDKLQNEIGKEFLLKPHEMHAYLSLLNIFRNASAHGERLYNLKTKKTPKDIKTKGKNDICAAIIILKDLLSDEAFMSFCGDFASNIQRLKSSLASIKIDAILIHMGIGLDEVNNWPWLNEVIF